MILSKLMPERQAAPGAFEAAIFPVDKPAGPTSFRMVQLVRRATGIKKTGHAGTLDPFATGLLVICTGRPATRLISQLMEGEKVYEAVLQLGVETETQDPEGEVISRQPVVGVTAGRVEQCLEGFLGQQQQIPPLYSALKHNGKPLYHYARKGIDIKREPRQIVISELECLDLGREKMKIRVQCSKGTYIRTLAADIGRELGCGAHLVELRRLQSGFFTVDEAVDGNVLAGNPATARKALLEKLISVEDVLAELQNTNK